MRRSGLAALVVLVGVGAGFAADDPIKARKDLMDGNGDRTKAVIPILKGAAPFNLATVDAALNQYIKTADEAPALFPPGSDKGKTHALPAIWQNKSDFEARFQKLGADSKAALAKITDAATFKANFPPILKDCGGCHEKYRAKMQ